MGRPRKSELELREAQLLGVGGGCGFVPGHAPASAGPLPVTRRMGEHSLKGTGFAASSPDKGLAESFPEPWKEHAGPVTQ